ncbi:MAG: gamma-glutamyltransferase [Gemmatimonadaceae bacterium]|nr:gamma-glutamyltransferase [Gemmatimonadaceae bacterium]
MTPDHSYSSLHHRAVLSRIVTTWLTVGAVAGVASCARVASPTAIAPGADKRVESDHGMVAASHPDAVAAGVEVLRLGGNAVDAAVATGFALSVTDISQTGLGGGGALTFYQAKTRRVEHLLFYPRSGSDAAWGRADTGSAATRPAGRAAAVPGMVAGLLESQAKYGKLTRAQVMAPAIRLARDGFIVSPLLARTIVSSRAKLMADTAAARRFFPNGAPLRPGERLLQPELAATLSAIASSGADAFYKGAVAQRLADKVRAQGGYITAQDMSGYITAAERPLCAPWKGYTVISAPPPMGGVGVVEMLQLAEMSGLTTARGLTDVPDAVVKLADVMRIGNADAGRWRGDPFAQAVPARGTTSVGYARARAALVGAALTDSVRAGDPWAFDSVAAPNACASFDPYPAAQRANSAGSDNGAQGGEVNPSFTSHMSVVDADGNAVSATTTVGVLFGSGVYTDGFFLNSSASNFDARTRGPNRFANTTMAPTIILENGAVRLVVGAAGSQYIQPAIVQVTLRMLAYGEDPGLALAAPRIHASSNVREVEVEPGFAPGVYQALVTRGYQPLSRVADISFGGVHAVFVRKDGKRIGVADPRRDGVAGGH